MNRPALYALLSMLCLADLAYAGNGPERAPLSKPALPPRGGKAPLPNVRLKIWPSRGFRPSETHKFLAGVLARENSLRHVEYHPDLEPEGFGESASISMHPRLLRSANSEERSGAKHVLRFAVENGFSITAEGATHAERTALRKALDEYQAGHLLESPPAPAAR